MAEPDLHAAIKTGDLEAIRASLDGGADVRYVRPHVYTPLIDALHIPTLDTEGEHLPILRLLIERGADLDAVSDYGESALSVASRLGWFEAVRLLLDAGADPAPLGWAPLHTAIALGTAADVRSRVKAGDELDPRDRWERTPWLLAVQTGDVVKAEILLAAGADVTARGRCGKTALMHAVGNGHHPMLRWLLDRGFDPNETDDFSGTPLLDAASNGDVECVRLLLTAGADLHHPNNANSTAIGAASNLETVRLLVAAGADLSDINGHMRAALTGVPNDGSIDCTPDEYKTAKHRVFGTANPERMNFPFWRAMVRGGACAYFARKKFDQADLDGQAVWCFDRFGKSLTELPDGRVVEIAGEHEDFYDPDFCIYNDVFVHAGDGTFDIYGYPAEVFPPTDFHTATLVGRSIYVIGNLGYQGTRLFGTTPVYRLSTDTWAIERVETTGESPGWISRHKADLVGGKIEVGGGKVCRFTDGKEHYEDNADRFALDLATLRWSRFADG
jgi:ankyrin repeat protein